MWFCEQRVRRRPERARGIKGRAFTGGGSNRGQLRFPRGIATDADGHVYVCDTQNNRIQIF